jgi:hypothetical protein
VRERIEYRFRVPSAAVFTLYSYSKALEYRFRVSTAGSLRLWEPSVGDRRDVSCSGSLLVTTEMTYTGWTWEDGRPKPSGV